ncbi:hypothetical protein ACFFMN_03390 [Planobispora siamensis]|uniref:hypothetical protein n=1 Tax=Planobispora siamensis TaxID=936338 RepID=UPI0019523F92|nr:hypothetical protein [Planobispora siamensis]
MTLIALRSAAQAGLDPGHEGWNDLLPGRLDGAIESARGWVGAVALILAAEAAVLAALGGRPNRRSTVGGLVLCTAVGMAYLMSLALAVLSTYAIVLHPSGDTDLGPLSPGWHLPALIVIAVAALTGLTVWLSAAVKEASAFTL